MTPQEHERRRRLHRVMTWRTFLDRNGLGRSTARRLRKEGKGPKVVQLSPRRIGVTYAAELEWQAARTGA